MVDASYETDQLNQYEQQQKVLNRHFPKAKVYLHGTYSSILGCKEDDANSLDYLLNNIEATQAQNMVLGGVSPTDFAHYKLGEMRFQFSPLH